MGKWLYCIEILKDGAVSNERGIFPPDDSLGYDEPKAAYDAILWHFRNIYPNAEVNIASLEMVK